MNPFTRRAALAELGTLGAALGVAACTRVESAPPATVASARSVETILKGLPTSDGAGVRLTRVIGQPRLRNLDPFLMLDHLESNDPSGYVAGFPDHPHRGFETVSIMRAGKMRHKDSRGNQGLIRGGGIQWMTAGRGIVHSEMPEQDSGLMSGFQLWVNLPKDEKMTAPFYQDMQPDTIPVVDLGKGGRGQVFSGDWFGVKGPIRPRPSDPRLAFFELLQGARIDVPVPREHRAFLFVQRGAIMVKDRTVSTGELAIFSAGERLAFEAQEPGASVMLASGMPFNEPIVQHGPFVMNTEDEIERAVYDYQRGTLGHD